MDSDFQRYYSTTGGSPEVCQLPAGMAEKTNWCYILCKYQKNKINTGQQDGSAAVRTVVKDRGV